ncbi:hypothetical protein JYK02_23655 [Corallococcus macrosporus]|uniref:Secreted protein n=1 Tax=Corallococcus macrosporus TaxID=35 RepID=A0ABS3DGU4_9BACT|nr:hypothetical protein [Corallococcus macrosporus]MBN8230513.1 hypothetical protein [Corallococcus macrosporus]
MPLHTTVLKGLVLASCLAASAAWAETPLVTCVLGASTTTYNPGVTNTPRDVTYQSTTHFPACVTGIFRPITSAVADTGNVLHEDLTCLELVRPLFPTQATFFWSDGGFSTVTLTQTRMEVEGTTTLLVGTGTVTAGRYLNAIATRTLSSANVDVTQGCLSAEGLKRTNGMASLVLALPD